MPDSVIQSQKCSWDEIKNDIKNLSPSLYDIIDSNQELVPQYIHLLHYPYGFGVLENGVFHTGISDGSDFKPSLCLVKKGCFEQNFIHKPMIKTLAQFLPGDLFCYDAIFEKLSSHKRNYTPKHLLNISSGARNAFLSQLSLSTQISALKMAKRYGIDFQSTDNAFKQFENFKLIAQKDAYKWHTSVYAFPESWINQINDKVLVFLLEYDIKQTHPMYLDDSQIIIDLLGNKININLSLFEKKIMHDLLLIGIGKDYAFQASLDESYAPIKCFQDAYINEYGLKNIPIFIKASRISTIEGDAPVYFSMQNYMNFLQQPSMIISISKLMENLSKALDAYCNTLKQWELVRESSSLMNLATKLKSKPIRSLKENLSEVLFSDPNCYDQIKKYPNLSYQKPGKFFSGCLQLMYESNDSHISG